MRENFRAFNDLKTCFFGGKNSRCWVLFSAHNERKKTLDLLRAFVAGRKKVLRENVIWRERERKRERERGGTKRAANNTHL